MALNAAPPLARTARVPREDRGTLAPIAVFSKDPNGGADYCLDYTDLLEGDRISTSTWTPPGGITKDSDTKSASNAVIWLSAGVDGTTYDILNRILTVAGRTFDRTLRIIVGQR